MATVLERCHDQRFNDGDSLISYLGLDQNVTSGVGGSGVKGVRNHAHRTPRERQLEVSKFPMWGIRTKPTHHSGGVTGKGSVDGTGDSLGWDPPPERRG